MVAVCSCVQARNPKQQPVIDAHVHFRTTDQEAIFERKMEEYFAENSAYDLRYAFGLTMAWRGQMDVTRAANDSLFAMAARNPRMIPVCSVHPHDKEEAIAELDRIVSLGGKIIKLHPISQNFEILDPDVIALVRAAGERDLIVLTDGYGFVIPNYIEHLLQVALNCPDTKIIIAHMGGTEFYKLGSLHMVMSYNPGMFSNLWFDLSATIKIYVGSPYQEQLEWVIRNVGTDRILFGSDDPAVSLKDALEAFYKLDLTDRERDQILYQNAKDLLRLD